MAGFKVSTEEEIIYGLFDLDDGVFRFVDELEKRLNVFPVNLQVQEILLRARKRYDEMQLNTPGVVQFL